MDQPQKPAHIQVNNTIVVGVVINKIILKQTKNMDMQLWW